MQTTWHNTDHAVNFLLKPGVATRRNAVSVGASTLNRRVPPDGAFQVEASMTPGSHPLPTPEEYWTLLRASKSMLCFFELRTSAPFFNPLDAMTEKLAFDEVQAIYASRFSSYSRVLDTAHYQAHQWVFRAFRAIVDPLQRCMVDGTIPLEWLPSPQELARIRAAVNGLETAVEALARRGAPSGSGTAANAPEPIARGTEAATAPPVDLGGPAEAVKVWGRSMGVLPDAEYRVIKALAEAYANGERLSETILRNRTKDARGNVVEDPVGALERLCEKDSFWRQVIAMSSKARLGYGLNALPVSP